MARPRPLPFVSVVKKGSSIFSFIFSSTHMYCTYCCKGNKGACAYNRVVAIEQRFNFKMDLIDLQWEPAATGHCIYDKMSQCLLHKGHVCHDLQVFFQERYCYVNIIVKLLWQHTLHRFHNLVDIRLSQSEPLID